MPRRFIAEHFRHDGRPKQAYANERDAAMAADMYDKDYYRCTFCGQFHLGSKHKEQQC